MSCHFQGLGWRFCAHHFSVFVTLPISWDGNSCLPHRSAVKTRWQFYIKIIIRFSEITGRYKTPRCQKWFVPVLSPTVCRQVTTDLQSNTRLKGLAQMVAVRMKREEMDLEIVGLHLKAEVSVITVFPSPFGTFPKN